MFASSWHQLMLSNCDIEEVPPAQKGSLQTHQMLVEKGTLRHGALQCSPLQMITFHKQRRVPGIICQVLVLQLTNQLEAWVGDRRTLEGTMQMAFICLHAWPVTFRLPAHSSRSRTFLQKWPFQLFLA